MIAVDTNVLVYAHRREVDEHGAAVSLLRDLATGDAPWAIPWPCIYEFFSVATNVRIWKRAASTPQQAWMQVQAWTGSPSLALLAEPPDFEQVLRAVARNPAYGDRSSTTHASRPCASRTGSRRC